MIEYYRTRDAMKKLPPPEWRGFVFFKNSKGIIQYTVARYRGKYIEGDSIKDKWVVENVGGQEGTVTVWLALEFKNEPRVRNVVKIILAVICFVAGMVCQHYFQKRTVTDHVFTNTRYVPLDTTRGGVWLRGE